jgi:hypothetical protein
LAENLAKLPLFPSLEEYRELASLGLPIQLALHGHHTVVDAGPRHASQPELLDEMPLAPVFVRDLCGRVIHTGLLPLPTLPQLPLFPAGCADVPASMGGAGYLEQAVFTLWTLLDISPPAGVAGAGLGGQLLRAAYAHPGAYPYKIRPNTFYADGWRLPQVPRVFTRRGPNAEALGDAFMHRWTSRPANQTYEAFYESVEGERWYEELFLEGVTIIPTLEAYNGAFQVNDDYSLQGVEAGRAVPGLHTVVEQRDSTQPLGTILDVIAPGFGTATRVVPAQVVVSRGPSLIPSNALLPNLSLPHPHVAAAWGACWLPTQPQHFAAPALWDWQPDGHFCQISGPLWCPQHYVYAATMPLVRATRRPLPECETLLQLPETLKRGFAPAIAQTWYDTLHERTRQERQGAPSHPLTGTALDPLPLAQSIASLGYHPLPSHWPTPLQAAMFPEMRHQGGQNACPAELAGRLAPTATPTKSATELAKHHQALSEPMRASLTAANQTEPSNSPPDWLPELPASQLQLNVKRLFANRHYRATLTLMDGTLPAALFRFKEAALSWRRLRYRLVSKYPAAWLQAETQGLALSNAEGLAGVMAESSHQQAKELRQHGLTRVPAPNAPALQPGAHAVKVGRRKASSKRHGTR